MTLHHASVVSDHASALAAWESQSKAQTVAFAATALAQTEEQRIMLTDAHERQLRDLRHQMAECSSNLTKQLAQQTQLLTASNGRAAQAELQLMEMRAAGSPAMMAESRNIISDPRTKNKNGAIVAAAVTGSGNSTHGDGIRTVQAGSEAHLTDLER